MGPLRRPLLAAGVGPPPNPPPFNATDIQAQFAAGMVPFGVHLLNRLLRHLQDDFGQLKDAPRGRKPAGPAAGWQGQAAPGVHLLPMPPPLGLMPSPFPPIGAHHHHHHHHLPTNPWGFPQCNTICRIAKCTRLLRFRSTSITITMLTSMRLRNIPSNSHRHRSRCCRSMRCRVPQQRRWECRQRVRCMRMWRPHPRCVVRCRHP